MGSGKASGWHTYWRAQGLKPEQILCCWKALIPVASCPLPGRCRTPKLFRSVSCLEESSLVAYKLNDRFLPLGNGFPARAVLPGWYAMDSVKWLRRIVVLGSQDEATEFHESG